jgi:Secreted protein acidic and rich in cysteine Ca binding region.
MALEHCIAPFLDSCDVDDNHRITLKEWGMCLQLAEVRHIFYCHWAVCQMMLMKYSL